MLMQPLSPNDNMSFHTMIGLDQESSMFQEADNFSVDVKSTAVRGRGRPKSQVQKNKKRETTHDIKPRSACKKSKKQYTKSSLMSS